MIAAGSLVFDASGRRGRVLAIQASGQAVVQYRRPGGKVITRVVPVSSLKPVGGAA